MVTSLLAAIDGTGARTRKGIARGTLRARENMAMSMVVEALEDERLSTTSSGVQELAR